MGLEYHPNIPKLSVQLYNSQYAPFPKDDPSRNAKEARCFKGGFKVFDQPFKDMNLGQGKTHLSEAGRIGRFWGGPPFMLYLGEIDHHLLP